MKLIDSKIITATSLRAKESPRKRMNYNFHELEEPLQRFINAVEPGSYVRPHRHPAKDKVEVFLLLKGKGAAFEFDNEGRIIHHTLLEVNGGVQGVIIDPGCWHTIIALEEGTVFFEVKIGPYEPLSDKDFAHWSPPPEDSDAVKSYLLFLQKALY